MMLIFGMNFVEAFLAFGVWCGSSTNGARTCARKSNIRRENDCPKGNRRSQNPVHYSSANCFAGYFVGNLSQMETLLPPKHKVSIYVDGNVKVVFMDEEDVATYTIKSIDDPRTLNKTLYLRPPENILSQSELVGKWENLTGKSVDKTCISKEEFLANMEGADFVMQVGLGHFYHIFFEGCLTNFEIGEDGEEASRLYPEVEYTRIHDYLNRYLDI